MKLSNLAGAALFVAAMTVMATPAHAAKRAVPEDLICVTIAHLWTGTGEDVANIASTPVPESYRRMFFAGGCTRFSLVVESLIDWHLAFGDEASASAALAFLEQGLMDDKPKFVALDNALISARHAAEPDFAAARRKVDREGRDSIEAVGRDLFARPAVARLRVLTQVQEDETFLAAQYLRAAQLFGSERLLRQARRYFISADAGYKALTGPAFRGDAGDTRFEPRVPDRTIAAGSDLQLAMAVVTAQVTDKAEDVDRADATLRAHLTPWFAAAPRQGDNMGRDLCDVGAREDLKPYREACESEPEFERRVISYWRHRAELDLVMARHPDLFIVKTRATAGASRAPVDVAVSLEFIDSFEAAMRLIEVTGPQQGTEMGLRRRTAATEAKAALYLARADTRARLAASLPDLRTWQARCDITRTLQGAINDLALAEALVPASEAPTRFHQIATRFLTVYDRIVSVSAGAGDDKMPLDPQLVRKAAYFRVVTDRLRDIATAH